jgi:hypothetical protein
MNFMDSTKIISPSACEISIPFRLTLLLSEITPWYATRHYETQSHPLFSSQDDLMQVKSGQIQPRLHSIR